MKEQALKIVSDLINLNKINGKDAVILIQAIIDSSGCSETPIVIDPIKPQSITSVINDVVIQPYGTSITATTDKQVEVIYDSQATSNKKETLIYG